MAGIVATVLVVLTMLGIGYSAVQRDAELTKDFNKSVVECVKAGNEPLTCEEAIRW